MLVQSGMQVDRDFLSQHDGADIVPYEIVEAPSPVQFTAPQGIRALRFDALRQHIFSAMDAGAVVGVVHKNNEGGLEMAVEGPSGGKFHFTLNGIGYEMEPVERIRW